MPYATLGALRARLRARLGFSAAGAAAGIQQTIVNDFLTEAQVELYWLHDWARLRKYTTVNIGLHETLVDYPADANPERIKAISINYNGIWTPPLKKGIPPHYYTYQTNYAPPKRWEPYAQIEFFPAADQIYQARIFYVQNLGAFTDDAHLATVDSDLIFVLALAAGKAHYRHPDATLYVQRAEDLKLKLKAKNWGKTVFNPSDNSSEEVNAKPVVI